MKMASSLIDLISKKTNCTCSTLFFLISKKTNLHVQHAFCLSLPLFCTFKTLFFGLKRQTSQLHIIFMEELSYLLTQYFVSCVHVRFYFFTAPHFHLAGRSLLAASISHCLTAALNFYVFLSTKFGCSSFSVIHVNVNVKNNIEKYMTLYFSLRAKCWLRGGVGGQFPRSV